MAAAALGQSGRVAEIRAYLAHGLTASADLLRKRFEAEIRAKRLSEKIPAEVRARALIDLMQALNQHMAYTPGATEVDTSAAQAFARRAGVCQDHTHAFLACARSLGIPARYVSGYLYSENSEHLASHAWAEAWLDDAWYSFDVTNQLSRPERHLKLAVGLDYLDACPVRGMRRGGGCEQMHAKVLVSPTPILPVLSVQQQ